MSVDQSDRYGGFDGDGNFLTAGIPPTYQNCTQEGRLSGCLVKDDNLNEQCSQGRTGKLNTVPNLHSTQYVPTLLPAPLLQGGDL